MSPDGADRIVGLGITGGGHIPTVHHLVETGAWWGLIVELDLVPLQIVTLQRSRVLLVLGFKGTRAHLGLELVEDFAWFTLWIEHIANPPAMGSAP